MPGLGQAARCGTEQDAPALEGAGQAATPEENAAVLRGAFEAWNRNDWEALMACYAPEVISVPPAEWPEAETVTSRDALRHQFEQTKAPWEEERVEIDEIRDLGDRVLALYRWIGRGRGSHAEVEHRIATLHTLRAGKIVRIEYFLDQSQALEAAEAPAVTTPNRSR